MTKRCQPLLTAKKNSLPKSMKDEGRHHEHNKKGKKFSEVEGGTTTECTTVYCCCPFTVMNLLILSVYKAQAGLCKKARRRQRKRQRLRKSKQIRGLLMGPRNKNCWWLRMGRTATRSTLGPNQVVDDAAEGRDANS
ncbi:hypothetical protein Ddye_015932 [Dipteronia dyeriana]|uniref:Uncharacterized protein n=1 Tax=Dipteronia dyeriana TaxID=168575 RepID=A0AAD9U6H9_9ROSI|nr:hypothetical protein Ddye_015932 [Dipteronia dyeriana]